jgi:hypothetical protein
MRTGIVSLSIFVLLLTLAFALGVYAGSAGDLDPPAGPSDPASQMFTLEQIYNHLDTGATGTKMTSFTEPLAGPVSTGHTLDEVMSLAMAVGNPDPPCADNTNRYVDCGNGTVHDTVTNLIWLKNANCFGQLDYAAAINAAAGLEDGECGLTDGSSPGDWRLPTEAEWQATFKSGCTNPPLANTPGTGCYGAGLGRGVFHGIQLALYMSSLASESWPDTVRRAGLTTGGMLDAQKSLSSYVWPVRAGK